MPGSIAITATAETDFTRKVRALLARWLARRLGVTVAPEAAVELQFDDRLPDGHAPGSEGYTIATSVNGGTRRYLITAAGPALLYGAGRLLRATFRDGRGVEWPDLQLEETPALPMRGIYFPTQWMEGTHGRRPFNAYAAWLHNEGRFDDFEDVLVELMLWGMNTIGLWYCEWMPAPGDGPEGERLERVYRRVVAMARDWRLRVCLLMTTTLLPPDPALAPHLSPGIPDGLWGKFEVPGCYCPKVPAVRGAIRDYRDKLIQLFQPDWIEVFPTDPGGCAGPECLPWWRTYLDLSRELLAPWVDRVPLRGVNLWYFWNRDAEEIARNIGTDGVINTVSTQGAWKESTRQRLRITDRLAKLGQRVVFWPDITMAGGWGTFGTYPMPEALADLFRLAKTRPYGVLPYTEGRYDDFNKFAMLQLAWQPDLATEELTRRVLEGMFGQRMPAKAVAAIAALEQDRHAEGHALLSAAEAQLDEATRADWRWYALRFYARHAGLVDMGARLLGELEEAKAAGVQPARSVRRLRRKVAAFAARLAAYQAELPTLYA
jgi:hypothetical protein